MKHSSLLLFSYPYLYISLVQILRSLRALEGTLFIENHVVTKLKTLPSIFCNILPSSIIFLVICRYNMQRITFCAIIYHKGPYIQRFFFYLDPTSTWHPTFILRPKSYFSQKIIIVNIFQIYD